MNMEKAKRFVTPRNKRVRETLDEEEPWNFYGFDYKQDKDGKIAVIETAL